MGMAGRAGAAFAVALSTGLFLVAGPGGSSPADAAVPCSCPAGYSANFASPNNPFCFSPTITPHQVICGFDADRALLRQKIARARAKRIPTVEGEDGFPEIDPFEPEDDLPPLSTDFPLPDVPPPLPDVRLPDPSLFQLGMYVTPNTGFGNGLTLGTGGYSARSSGVGVTDTAGLLAPGSISTGSQTNAGSGGIRGSYDASYLVGSNQKLRFNGAFNYTSSNTNFAGASGSINSDTYGFKGSVLYSNYNTYLVLKAAYEFGNNNEFFAGDASSGSYRSDGYYVDARLGRVFVLFNTIVNAAPLRMAVKAPPKPSGGYAIGLDLSGHLGYASNVARGFTDTSGFVFGDERTAGGVTGLRAKLFATVPRNGVIWQPYISGSVGWRFDYSHIASFPTQVALAGGDAVSFADGTTILGAQVGLDVKVRNGWTVGVNGFYSHSSDTEIAGGRAYVRIPFGPATVAARY